MTRERLDALRVTYRDYPHVVELMDEVARSWRRIESLRDTIGRANARLEGLMERRKEGRVK